MWLCAVYLSVLLYGEPLVVDVHPNYRCHAGGGMIHDLLNKGPLVFRECQYQTADGQPVPVTAAMIKEFEETGDRSALCMKDMYREESFEVALLYQLARTIGK